MTHTRIVAVIALGALAAAASLEAHHSFAAQYDANKPITLRGTISRMLWSNPHGHLYIDVKMPDGKPVPEMELLAPSAGYDPLRSTFAIWIERWLNEVGIPVKANLTGFNIIVDRTRGEKLDFDMFILGWGLSLYPDYLEAFFHSRHAEPGDFNAGGYSNPEFDKLADELLAESDLNEARKKVFKMQEFLADDLPYVVLFTTPILESYRSDRLKFPYTETLGGLQNGNGLTTVVAIQ